MCALLSAHRVATWLSSMPHLCRHVDCKLGTRFLQVWSHALCSLHSPPHFRVDCPASFCIILLVELQQLVSAQLLQAHSPNGDIAFRSNDSNFTLQCCKFWAKPHLQGIAPSLLASSISQGPPHLNLAAQLTVRRCQSGKRGRGWRRRAHVFT